MAQHLCREDYTVGWVCALPVELAAAQEMLDEEHDTPRYDAHDTNLYTCGRVGEHNVVIACLPEGQMGTNSAAAVAVQMKSTFSSTRFGLMVGIGGGVPSEEADIRLGDVVVSKPHKTHGGVVQYDLGKATPSGFERTGALNTPPTVLLNAVANVRAKQMRGKGRLLEYLSRLDSLPDFTREAAGPDVLYDATYNHIGSATCAQCKTEHTITREVRRQEVVVHYGTVASGNQVMRSAAERDRVSAALGGVLCFEMEAAGLMNSFPCLVIRGICDYADSHKNKQWQPYAAGTAAAYAKEVLSVIPPAEVAKLRTAVSPFDKASRNMVEKLFRQIIDERGEDRNDHQLVVDGRFWFGYTLYQQGRYGEAEVPLKKAVQSRAQACDDSHPKTIRSKQLLGHVLYMQAKYSEAERFLQEATTAWRKLCKRNSAEILFSTLVLGHTRYKIARYRAAEESLREAVAGFEQLFGKAHKDRLHCLHLLGCVLYRQSKYGEAENTLEEAVVIRENVLGYDHFDTIVSKFWFGRTLSKQMAYSKATSPLRQAAYGLGNTVGEGDEKTIQAKHLLGCALYHQGKHGEAEQPLRQAVDGLVRINSNQRDITNTKRLLGCALYHQAKYGEAEGFFRQVADDWQTAFGRDNANTIEIKQLLGHTLYLQAKYSQAEKMLREAMTSQEKRFGRDHEDTQSTKHWLDRVLADQRNQKRANTSQITR